MSLTVKASLVPAFGRHETFTPRYAWFKKGYDAIVDDPEVFSGDAHQVLGVGKNMARSIRYWLQAMRIAEELPVEGTRRNKQLPTVFGEALFETDWGLDPYLEASDSWWLLHWMALSPGALAPVWWSAFHTFGAVRFTTDALFDHVMAQIAASGWGSPDPRTVRKDILALLRCYGGSSGSRRADKIDDVIDAPFVQLGLLSPDGDGWRFALGPKPGLAPAVAAFACLDYLWRSGHTSRSQLIASLATDQGAPGRALKLTERDLGDLLHAAANAAPDLIGITSTAGADALVAHGSEPLGLVAARVLHAHYTSIGPARPRPQQPYLPWSQATEQARPLTLPLA